MTSGLLGHKLGMAQIFVQGGRMVPVTVIEAGPCRVAQVKTVERDGYAAVQLSFDEVPDRKLSKAAKGHFSKAQLPGFRHVREFRANGENQIGATVKADLFSKGEHVDVTGISKGKGFQGVMKRHHFHGGPRTHGSMFHRAPGSIGSSSSPSRVWKNMKMAGHMGSVRVTTQGLEVMEVRSEENLIFLRGSVPGSRGSVVMIQKSKKTASGDRHAKR
ncbi:MAG: 50S ribosomal protein L3 [Nitrospirae bacterium]|nr:MAG: 50S ribosomal protein L3 [Nitrospirota bacterium]